MENIKITSAVLNGPMMIRVEDDHVSINVYQHETKLPYQPKENPDPIEGVVGHRKGSLSFELTSDIFDCLNLNFKENRLDKDTMIEIFNQMMNTSLPFIAKISKEENLPVLIQNSFDEKKMYFLSTIGLLDDARIIFAEIKQVEKIKRGKATKNA